MKPALNYFWRYHAIIFDSKLSSRAGQERIMGNAVIYSILGTTLDVVSKRRGKFEKRWDRWRPTVSIVQRSDVVDASELVILCCESDQALADEVKADVLSVKPACRVRIEHMTFADPWDLGTTYVELLDFIKGEKLGQRKNAYFHITTGSHIQQIVAFLLSEARVFPGRLLQTAPPRGNDEQPGHHIIDLDLSKYDVIANRFKVDTTVAADFLKAGIRTANNSFNAMIQQIERVALRSDAPLLITGPTGAGKSQLARRIYELKKIRHLVQGEFVETNCATLIGENSMSTLFGHTKGAFTGAASKREGLLKRADNGVLFLDEVGELGLDEQAMLLRAIEDHVFLPMGSDKEDYSQFQLIAGTNKDLRVEVAEGRFRGDLFARINLWTYRLPGLAERKEDIPANIDYELEKYQEKYGEAIRFNSEARKRYIEFATSPGTPWKANFRDLNASITRMATLSDGGRIDMATVRNEIDNLRYLWLLDQEQHRKDHANLSTLLPEDVLAEMDYIEKIEFAAVVEVCRQSKDAATASRALYDKSRLRRKTKNDSHRLLQYLKKYGLHFDDIKVIYTD